MIFETDAKLVVDALSSTNDDHSEFGDIITRCRVFLHHHGFFYVKSVR